MDDCRDGFAGEGVVENEFTFFEIFHIHSAKLVRGKDNLDVSFLRGRVKKQGRNIGSLAWTVCGSYDFPSHVNVILDTVATS